jgi:lipopolysaccharide export LptBFGC system permease protein LptF
MTEPARPRRRHLIDPNAPRPVRDHESENKSLTRVQRWVMSALAVTTIFHLVMGLIIAALYIDNPRPGAQVGLCLIAGAFGVIAVAVAFVIHGKKPFTPWLLVGLIPSAIGLFLIYR